MADEILEGGQDAKFKFENGHYVNRVSGEAIPHDEPVVIFRARDRHAVPTLAFYLTLVQDDHHRAAVMQRIDEFSAFAGDNPSQMKEPGVTRHMKLKE